MSDTVSDSLSEVSGTTRLVMAYDAVIERGYIRAPAGLADGIRVFVVVPAVRQPPAPGTPEWRRPFEIFESFVRAHPAPANIDQLSDDQLNAIVHQAREHLHAAKSGD